LEKTIRTTPARAFAAWTEAEQLRKWSAPEGMTLGEGELDLRVGGRFSIVMKEPNGTRHTAFGVYREITPPTRLVYTHAWLDNDGHGPGSSPETIVTVEFKAEGDRTRVVLTQTGFGNEASREGHRAGWSSVLDRLQKMLEAKS
jgi:uncharacterized protein YndB with AHSA1/START domain